MTLDEQDFTEHDESVIRTLSEAFPADFLSNNDVLQYNAKCFVLSKEDMGRLTSVQEDTLWNLSASDQIENPVYVHIGEDGVLLID